MKKIIAITIIIALTLAVSGCLNNANDETMPPNTRIMGRIAEINGNVLTLAEMETPGGGTSGRVVFRGGEQVQIVNDNDVEDYDLDCEEDYDYVESREEEYFVSEPVEGENGEELPVRGRIAGADAEVDRIRIADAPEGGVIRVGGGDVEAPQFRYTGNVRTVTIPRGMNVTVGMDGEQVETSTLEVGNVIFVMYDADGRMESLRLMPVGIETAE